MFRSVCFTLFEYGSIDEYVREFGERFESEPKCIYTIFQEEKCPETDRNHLQGYCQFKDSWRLNRIQRFIGSGVHIEKRRGSLKQAIDYCRKSDTRISGPYTYGEEPKQGRRGDLESIRDEIKAGSTELEIAEKYFGIWCTYRKAFSDYKSLICSRRTQKTKVAVLWGVAGTGKTRAVYDKFGFDGVYDLPRPNGGSVWFDGYKQQKCLLIDDFYGWIPFHLLLKLGDRYPLQLQRKGGFVEFNSEYLVITSNKPWNEWYDMEKIGRALEGALRRRFDLIVEFGLSGPIEEFNFEEF